MVVILLVSSVTHGIDAMRARPPCSTRQKQRLPTPLFQPQGLYNRPTTREGHHGRAKK